MQCPYCHNPMPTGTAFCPTCGRRPMDYVNNGPAEDQVDLLTAFKRYAQFSGRARRKEYWLFILLCFIAGAAGGILDGLLGTGEILVSLVWLVMFLPGLGVTIRRLHDTGRSGFWVFLSILPIVGPIVLFIFYVQDSQPGANEYGPNPKGF